MVDELVECSGIARGWWVPAEHSQQLCACMTRAIEDAQAADALIQERRLARHAKISTGLGIAFGGK